MNRPHYSKKINEKEYAIDRIKSPFIKYSMTATACILICSVAFVMLVFQTNTIIDVDSNTVKQNVQDTRVKVSSAVTPINQSTTQDPDIPGLSETPIGDGTWYQSIPNDLRSKGSKVKDFATRSGRSIPLYDRLPWDANDDTYRFDIVQASKDVVTYIDAKAGKPSNLQPKSAIVWEYKPTSSKGYTYKLEVDGIEAITIAPPPCVYYKDYCDNFTKNSWSGNTEYGSLVGYHKDSPIGHHSAAWDPPRKYCVELTDKSGQVYYVPACAVDSKGHTFPGGVMQTHLKILNNTENPDGPFTVALGDTGNTKTFTWTELVDSLDTLTGLDNSSDVLRAFFQVNLEINGIDEIDTSDLNREFDVTAYYAW